MENIFFNLKHTTMVDKMLGFEVQRQDGTNESSLRAIQLILEEFKREGDTYKLPRSVERLFFEEFDKVFFGWIKKEIPGLEEMKKMHKSLWTIIRQDEVLLNPYNGIGQKWRFGANLYCRFEMMDTYIRSSSMKIGFMELVSPEHKDEQDLLVVLYSIDHAIAVQELLDMHPHYKDTKFDLEAKLVFLAEREFIAFVHTDPSTRAVELTTSGLYAATKISHNEIL
jgi:hypothetical protein